MSEQSNLVLNLDSGEVVIKLRPDLAPEHVAGSASWPERAFTTMSSSTA